MLIQDVTIKKIPTAATAVCVTIAPLWQSLTVGGTYSTTNGSNTMALTRQEDGRTWQNADSAYLLPPSSQPASVSVTITIGSTTKTYTYSTNNELEAGYKINIEGTYTEAVGVNLTGTITGAMWLGERTISFEFDENGSTAADEDNSSSDDDNGSIVGDLPAVGSFYQGCYVLKSIVADDGQSAELTLLSPNEATIGKAYNDASFIGHPEVLEALIDEKLNEADVDGISDWHLPTYDELNVIYAALNSINDTFESDVSANGKYLYDASGTILYRILSQTAADGADNFAATARIRPVATISITKE